MPGAEPLERRTGRASLRSGACVGLAVAAAATALRWASWEPQAPLFVPYDALATVGLAAPAYAICARRAPQRALEGWISGVLMLAVFGAWLAWLGPPRWVLAVAAVLTAAAAGLALRRGRAPRLSAETAAALGAGALALAGVGSRFAPGLALGFPSALVALAALGPPRAGSPRGAALCAALFAGAVAASASFAFPLSRTRVPTEIAAPPGEGPSAILIVLDTLRADRLSLYGHSRPTTPRLDAWAEGSLVFTNARSTAPWTLPSHASMFTGLAPRSHGAHGYRPRPGEPPVRSRPLPESATTIAELAQEVGIETAAIVANFGYVNAAYGLAQGFRTFWSVAPRGGMRLRPVDAAASRLTAARYREIASKHYRARHVTDQAIRWLDAARGHPFFLFVNYIDVHQPNIPASLPRVWSTVPLEEEEAALADVYLTTPEARQAAEEIGGWAIQLWVDETHPIDPRVARKLANDYDRELVYLDHHLGRLLDHVERTGLSRTTTVLVTSDHGEAFGEHGMVFHGPHLWDELIRVPLLLRGPGIEPGTRSDPVSGLDVFDTLRERLGLRASVPSEGRSLLAEPLARPLVSEVYAAPHQTTGGPRFRGRFDRDLRSVFDGRYKLFASSRGELALYDLARDPAERVDLARRDPAERRRLEQILAQWEAEHPPSTSRATVPPPTAEDRERLRALGYVP